MPNIVQTVDIATQAFWVLLAIAVIVALYYGYKYLKKLYDAFTAPGGEIEEQIVNMFTPHNDSGGVDPIDIAPKGTDPIDWLFMDHSLSAPI